ncbi:hypothetical protein GCM10009789_46990 [Kribbella sancticallisti]|uniref:DUF4132 domain-containing protein n=1 Tax=Kribbella sancticallisti TaxID=460087 RepID=A0ABN2DXH6_9ACTN
MGELVGRRDGADVGVPQVWSEALGKVLARLDDRVGGLAEAVENYVLTGSPESALAKVEKIHSAAGTLVVHPYQFGEYDETYKALQAGSGSVPDDVLLRWARVLEAAWQSAGYYAAFEPVGGGRWAEALLVHLTLIGSAPTDRLPVELPVDHEQLERMLALTGADPSDLLVQAFRHSANRHAADRRASLRSLIGFEAAVRRHADVLRTAMTGRRVADQLAALEVLGPLSPELLSLFPAELARMATSSSAQVRSQAAAPIAKIDAVEPLKAIAAGGKPDERREALRLLRSRSDAGLKEWARDQATADRSLAVRALAEEWDQAGAETEVPGVGVSGIAGVEVPAIDWKVPVTDELRAHLLRFQTALNSSVDRVNSSHQAQVQGWSQRRLDDEALASLIEALEAGRPPVHSQTIAGIWEYSFDQTAEHLLVSPLLGPAGLTILLNHLGLLSSYGHLTNLAVRAFNALHGVSGSPTFLELSTMLDQMGADGPKIVFGDYSRVYHVLGQGWPDEDIAPFVLLNLTLVTEALTPNPSGSSLTNLSPLAAFRALATLPSTPPLVVDALFALALGSRKTEHGPAQEALARVPGIGDRVVTALSDGKADVRTAAAQWLPRLGHSAAVPALEAAVAREKKDVPKGAMLDALQAFGQPVEKYLTPESLAKQAAAGLAKGLPKELGWLRWEAVPAVRWADSGEAMAPEVLKWFVVQAVKAKSPEPNVILRKYCSLLDPVDREAFGQYLLEAWLAEDLRPVDHDEAHRLAEQEAQWAHSYGGGGGLSVAELTARYLPSMAGRPAGSAIGAKGVLAVAAACAGERAAAPVARYLKEWYGMRAAQGKALIAMLGWIEHPGATQLMLSIGSRFRTKSFQEEATRQAEALAERKGWTLGELADRTIPAAGFDESGVIELSYGDRTFTAVLLPSLTVELRSSDGRKISALPAPRQSDDEERVKASKKALTLAKKELKAIVQLQTARLYEALCTERTWRFDDWQLYLNRHPVVRHLTQRLAWVATTADGATVVRPLDDGTLTDVNDEEVSLPPDAMLAIAHDSLLDEATVQAWQEHLADYEVAPLFQQFGKGTFTLPEDQAGVRASTDFEGHLLEAFALRGRAGKLGYTRGLTEDAGWFYTYEKRFPTLGLTAVVEFTGNPLPEENRTVALKNLRFVRTVQGGEPSTLQLGEVPSVLLSEAYNDVRLMAADGTGFDPEWEKKSEY